MTGKHLYISVMGTMGSGKTTVAKLIADQLKLHLLEENFGENAFLAKFYQDMKRWAFHSQTFFLMEKITQMLDTGTLLAKYSVVQDTPIEQDVYSYAKAQHVLGNLDDAEWKLYLKIYKSFLPYFPEPDLCIFLDTTVPELLNRIENRGRGYEQKIPASYVELLDMLNRNWLRENRQIPVLTVKTDGLDVVHSQKARLEIIKLVKHELQHKKV